MRNKGASLKMSNNPRGKLTETENSGEDSRRVERSIPENTQSNLVIEPVRQLVLYLVAYMEA